MSKSITDPVCPHCGVNLLNKKVIPYIVVCPKTNDTEFVCEACFNYVYFREPNHFYL
jgi:hypothetical protein